MTTRRGFFRMLAGLAAVPFLPKREREWIYVPRVGYRVKFSVGLAPDMTKRVRFIDEGKP